MGAILEKNRSKVMSSIKSQNTKIELIVRKLVWDKGFRFKVNNSLPGRPDIIFPKKHIAVFIDGDFWHGYNWKVRKIIPKNHFWKNKINVNMQRDSKVNFILKKLGWKVIRIWEHEIIKNPNKC